MNAKQEFKNLTEEKQNILINNFKKAYGYKTHIDMLTGDLMVDFENYLWAHVLEV